MKPDESSLDTPAPPAASHRVSLSPYVNEQLANWEELFSAHNVARMVQLADPYAHAGQAVTRKAELENLITAAEKAGGPKSRKTPAISWAAGVIGSRAEANSLI